LDERPRDEIEAGPQREHDEHQRHADRRIVVRQRRERTAEEIPEPRRVEEERIVVVEGLTFSGSDAKKAASASPDINVEVTASKAMSGPIRILKPWA